MEVLTEAPRTEAFTPLAEHLSTTPASFHSGPPILHYYSDRCKVIVLEDEANSAPAIANFVSKISTPASSQPSETTPQNGTNGDSTEGSSRRTIKDIDVWVTSDKLLLYSISHETGLSIPYPTISLHAIQSLPVPTAVEPQSQGLYMQLIPSTMDFSEDDELPDTVSVTIIPTASAAPSSSSLQAPTEDADDALKYEDRPEQTPIMALFTALSNCSNLHPDPVDPEDEGADGGEGASSAWGSRLVQAGLAVPGTADGSLPPPMPGSGGWITAENVNEFFDEQGNWIGGEDEEMGEDGDQQDQQQLGPGAGTVRSREPDDDVEGPDTSADASNTKWQRTS